MASSFSGISCAGIQLPSNVTLQQLHITFYNKRAHRLCTFRDVCVVKSRYSNSCRRNTLFSIRGEKGAKDNFLKQRQRFFGDQVFSGQMFTIFLCIDLFFCFGNHFFESRYFWIGTESIFTSKKMQTFFAS